MNRLGGWGRIGVVISILWSISVFGLTAIDYYDFYKERKHNLTLPAPANGFVVETKAQSIFIKWQPVNLLANDSSSYVRDFQLQGSRLLMAWLLPMIALWVVSFLVDITFNWVKSGFKKGDDIGSS